MLFDGFISLACLIKNQYLCQIDWLISVEMQYVLECQVHLIYDIYFSFITSE